METETMKPLNGVRRKVPLPQIVKGNNPRTEFPESYIESLARSIDALDIIEDPVVYQSEDGTFPILAGECRIRGARKSKRYGEAGEIWVLVRDHDEALNGAVSLTENVERLGMGPVDEAHAAAKCLAACGNDRDEAARVLGWNRETLDVRLALMNAAPEVRDALRNRKIKLGHAELLASMRKESQIAALGILLGRDTLMTVNEFKALIEKAALVLDTAIFDKKDCGGCQHNSSNQAVLFAEAISGGKCTNKSCFDGKTEAELQAHATSLADEYQVVRVVRPGENFTVVPLVADGPKGVGEQQAKECRSCKSFGAVVSGVPDKMGLVYKDMCLDTVCNVKMVAAHNKPPEPANVEQKGKPDAKATGSGKGEARPSKAEAKGAATTSVEPANRVKEYREKLWRKIFTVAVAKLDIPSNRAVLLALCLTRPSVLDSHALVEAVKHVDNRSTMSPAVMLKKVLSLDHKVLAEALQQIAANVNGGMHGLSIDDVTGILKAFDVKVADYWKVTKPFLELLTKNEIDAVSEELAVKAALGAEYAKARNLSKGEFIDAVLATKGFDFAGKIPKIMTW